MLVAIILIANTSTNIAFCYAMYKWAKRQEIVIHNAANTLTNSANQAANSITGVETAVGDILDRASRASLAFHGGESK